MPRYHLTIADKTFDVEILSAQGGQARVLVNGRPYDVRYQEAPAGAPAAAASAPAMARLAPSPAPEMERPSPPAPSAPEAAPSLAGEAGAVTAPMPGTILEILVKTGDAVKAGDVVVKLEAMKMENDVPSPVAGVVSQVRVAKGANVTKGEVLLVVAPG
jgi:biotin carboxyl carrier protein